MTDSKETRNDVVNSGNGEEHATLHADETANTVLEDKVFARYTSVIRQNLRGGNKALARVGAYLCMVKAALLRLVMSGGDEDLVPFTQWLETLGLSVDRARRLMRWVRPVLESVNWDNDNDPVLNELADIGPCRFDEVQKFPIDQWRFTEEGNLLLADISGGGAEILARNLSVREIQELRARNAAQDQDVETDNIEEQTNSENIDMQEQDVATCADDAGHVDYDDNELAESDQDNASGNVDSDNIETDDSHESVEEYSEEESGENDIPEDCRDESSSLITQDDGEQQANVDEETNDEPAGNVAVTAVKKRPSDTKNRIDLNQKDPDVWLYGVSEVESLTVVNGKIKVASIADGVRVCGVNVDVSVLGGHIDPLAVNKEEDAFCVMKVGTRAVLYWFDHETGSWQKASIETKDAE